MRFHDREKELEMLERLYSRRGADLAIVSGRRRIGKSRLIEEFMNGKNAVSVFIVPKEEKQLAKDIEEEVRAKFGYSPPFDSFRSAMEYLFEYGAELVFFDEFPNVLNVNKAIPYELQRLWDKYRDKKEILIIVSGSYAGMMNKLFAAKKAPLFNRATNTLNLEHLSFESVVEILKDMGISDAKEQISYFCLFGGVPYYYVLLEKEGDTRFERAVNSLFFDAGAQLKEEGENILKQEFGNAYSKYYAILEAIHSGCVSMNEISQKIGVRSTTFAKYMKALQHDFKIVGRMVPFGQNFIRSKKGAYFILDNTLAFWFVGVYGKRTAPSKEEMNAFIGRRFELFCREFLVGWLERKGERVLKAGKWWGAAEVGEGKFEEREIDVIVETEKALYVGECKWIADKIGKNELLRLKESARALVKIKKPLKFVLFSREGFALDSKEAILFDPKRIAKECKV